MNNNFTLEFPPSIQKIAKIFFANGFELYAVGGAIRDMLNMQLSASAIEDTTTRIAKSYSDIDFATNATPQEVMRMFKRTIPTGLQHGTVSILFGGSQYEVTSYRVETTYSNHRSPDNIKFASSIQEDLSRRDFTVNAIAVDPLHNTLIDLYNGIEDLQKKIIRCVGEASLRFSEDALRMLRAIRFATSLNFNIEGQCLLAIQELHKEIHFVSKERICTEFRKILCAAHVEYGISLLRHTHSLQHILPTHNGHIQRHLGYCRASKKAELDSDTEILRLAACLSYSWNLTDMPNVYSSIQQIPLATEALKTLRFPNKIIDRVITLVSTQHYIRCTHAMGNTEYSHIRVHLNHYKLVYLAASIGIANTKLVLEYLCTNILLLKTLSASSQFQTEADMANNSMLQLQRQLDSPEFKALAISKSDLAINGNTVAKVCKRPPGKWIGSLLATLHRHVLRYPEDNDNAALVALISNKYARQ